MDKYTFSLFFHTPSSPQKTCYYLRYAVKPYLCVTAMIRSAGLTPAPTTTKQELSQLAMPFISTEN